MKVQVSFTYKSRTSMYRNMNVDPYTELDVRGDIGLIIEDGLPSGQLYNRIEELIGEEIKLDKNKYTMEIDNLKVLNP